MIAAEDTTRADLEEAMSNAVDTLRRMPSHWTDRRAELHRKIDGLLDAWMDCAGR